MKRTGGTSKKLKKDNDNHSPTIDRFGSDFEFLKKLGKGGYGEVVKVRNNLDGRKYAIKKIKLKSYKSRLLEEVKTLSRLNHKYIVRYFHAWIENQSKSANDSDSEDIEPDDLFRTKAINNKKPFVVPVKKYKSSSEEDLFPKFKEDEPDDSSYSSDSWMFEDKPPTAVCAMCDKTFTDFDADREAIDRLPKSVAIEKLCIDCFNARLRQVGANISVKASQKKKKPTIPQILYIQMEYCKNTLRQKIDEGTMFDDVDLSWQILGQILQGLAYIHQQGIIHRDLCPGNIFFDDEGNVKIGDFGLATKINSTITDDSKDMDNTKDNLSDGSSSSSSLEGGTFLYISPEGNHGEKCDIYSLGIILFEMTYQFKTKMERSNVLQDIRTKQKFPKDFEDVKYAQLHKVIESMLIKDPASRPKALDLLNGNLLPSSAFSDHAITLESLSCPQSVSFVRVMDTLFSDRKRIISCSEDQIKRSFQVKDDLIRYEQITQKIKNTFKYYSALPTKSNWIDEEIIEAREVFYPSFYDHAEFLLRTGAILHFPYDLRLAFAKKVANNIDQVKSNSPYKRYEIGPIYRKNRNADSPDVFEIANFDIVFHQETIKETGFSLSINNNNPNHEQEQMSPRYTSPIAIRNTPNDYAYPKISFSPEVSSLSLSRDGLSSSLPVYRMSSDILNSSSEEIESVIAEAEIIRVVLDVMEGLQSLITSYFIVLSHVAFADALMQVLNISEITKETVYRIIGATTRDSWSIVAEMLRKDAGLNEDAIEALINYYKIKGTPKQALNDIQIFFSIYQNSHPSVTKSVTSAVRHTQLLLQLLDDFLVSHRKGVIEINCRLATHNKEFSSGMYFGVIALVGEKKRMQMVGKGGRYDSVVDYFLDKQSSQTSHSGFPSDSEEDKKVGAVGLTLVIDRLVSAYEAQDEVKMKYFDSYVVSDPSLIHERIQIATKLRNAGIIADFSYSKSLSLEAQKSIGSAKAKFVIILDESYYKNGTVRLNETANKDKQDFYVHRDKIASCIKPDENKPTTPASSPPRLSTKAEVYHSYQGRQTSQQLRSNYYSKLFSSNERKS